MTLEHHGLGGQHADVFQTLHVGQVALTEGHKEADALNARDGLCQRLDFLVVQKVHVLVTDLIKVVLALDGHGRNLNPVAVLPVGTGCGYLTQVDLGVKVGCERVAVVTAVAVQNVDGIDLVKQVLLCVSAVRLGNARVETGAEQRGQTGLLELLAVVPLVGVIEVCREASLLAALLVSCTPFGIVQIFGLVVCGVHVVDAAGQTSVHDGQILIGQGDIHDEIGLNVVNECDQLVYLVGIDLTGGDLGLGGALELLPQRVALGLGAACDADFLKDLAVLAALVDCDRRNAAAADD